MSVFLAAPGDFSSFFKGQFPWISGISIIYAFAACDFFHLDFGIEVDLIGKDF